jgi:hypothetical protein
VTKIEKKEDPKMMEMFSSHCQEELVQAYQLPTVQSSNQVGSG